MHTLGKPAGLQARGYFSDVSDRNLQPQLTQQAEMPTDFIISVGISAFAGLVNGLKARPFASEQPGPEELLSELWD